MTLAEITSAMQAVGECLERRSPIPAPTSRSCSRWARSPRYGSGPRIAGTRSCFEPRPGACCARTGSCDPLDNNYPQEALALTTVSAVISTGVIRDVDIEVNAALDHNWADLVAHPDLAAMAQTMNIHDLQNALTHEFGHLVGLDHTCHNPGTEAPLNHLGEPIPTCPTASADVQETTMFLSARPGDTHMRTLAPDDQQAVCDIYPAASDPMTCSPPPPIGGDDEGCNCATVGARSPARIAGELIAFGLVCGLLVFARRRGSRV